MDGLGTIETNEMLIIRKSSSSRKTNQDETGIETTFDAYKDTGQVRIPEKSSLKIEISYKVFVDELEQKFLKASFAIDLLQINQVEQQIDKIQLTTRRNLILLNLRSGYDFLGNFEQFILMNIFPAESSLSEQKIDVIKNSTSYLPGVTVNEIFSKIYSFTNVIEDHSSSISLSSGAESQKIDTLLLVKEEFTSYETQIRCLFSFNEQITLFHDRQGRALRALNAKYKVYFLKSELKAYSYQDLYNFLMKLLRARKKMELPVKINLDSDHDLALHSEHDNFPDLSNDKLGIIYQKEQIYKHLNINSSDILSPLSVGLIIQLPRNIQYKETSTKCRFIELNIKLCRQLEIRKKKLWTHLDLIDDVVLKNRILQQQEKYEQTELNLEKSTPCADFDPVRLTRLYSSYDGAANEEEERDSKPSYETKTKMCIGNSKFDRFTRIQETEKAWRLAIENSTIINSAKIPTKFPISEIKQDNAPEIRLGHNFSAPEKSTISVFTDIRIKNREDSKHEKQLAASEQYRNEVFERVARKEKAINFWEAELEATALLAQANSRAIVKRKNSAVIDKRFPAAWSRYSSHDRIERLTSALSLEGVKVQDFAKIGLKNNEIIWRLAGDSSNEEVDPENCGQRKNFRRKFQASATLFLYKIKLKDVRLQATQGQGRRGSMNVAGEMEFPELELLPFSLMTDVEIENEVYEEDEKKAKLRYAEKTEKLEEANHVKFLNEERDAGSQRMSEEALLKEKVEIEYESRCLSFSDIVISKDFLNVIVKDEVDEFDVTCRATSPCPSISEFFLSII
ncbi:hypothetical protein Golomagni_05148 [Golovinomyces magnicellulatus]|nr:hypothetical protein Golomagni_05148 [Golovinomyces magnicellulatus]